MIRLRVRFRIFLLLSTLASLIAASAAIRTRVGVQVEVGAVRSGDDVSGHVRRQGRVAVELSSFDQGLTRFKTSSTRPEPGLLASSFARSLPPPAGRQTV